MTFVSRRPLAYQLLLRDLVTVLPLVVGSPYQTVDTIRSLTRN